MLKLTTLATKNEATSPAAFRRLCVETFQLYMRDTEVLQPPSGGCVLKLFLDVLYPFALLPAAFRRLCVETSATTNSMPTYPVSRLRAAVC